MANISYVARYVALPHLVMTSGELDCRVSGEIKSGVFTDNTAQSHELSSLIRRIILLNSPPIARMLRRRLYMRFLNGRF